MSLLWTQAMAWYDDDRETDPNPHEFGDYRDKRPYDTRRPELVEHIADAHDVPPDAADRALEKIENHTGSRYAPAVHFGFSSHHDLGDDPPRSAKFWSKAEVTDVPLKGMKASQDWVRPASVAHNLFNPGSREPMDDETIGDPDYDPEWDDEFRRESDEYEDQERRQSGDPEPAETDLPRFIRHSDGTHTCADGHHRVSVAILLGKKTIRGRVVDEHQYRSGGQAS